MRYLMSTKVEGYQLKTYCPYRYGGFTNKRERKEEIKMSTQMQKLQAVLSYMEIIDRNGSWNEVTRSIENNESTLLFELEILKDTLTEWLEEEKSGGLDTLATEGILKGVKRMIREELAK